MVAVIKTSKLDFDSAESYGYIYGYIIRQEVFPVYVELGKEKEYIPSAKDNEKTEYKLFINCSVLISETDEKLDEQEYVQIIEHISVKIYC